MVRKHRPRSSCVAVGCHVVGPLDALAVRYTVLAAVLEKLAHGERFGFHGVPLMVCAFWPVRTMASLGRGDWRVLRVIWRYGQSTPAFGSHLAAVSPETGDQAPGRWSTGSYPAG